MDPVQGCAFSAIFRGKLCGNYAVEIRNCAVLCGKEKTHFIAFYWPILAQTTHFVSKESHSLYLVKGFEYILYMLHLMSIVYFWYSCLKSHLEA